ncbi:DUF6153 family protein [Dactylosporangium sucinum]|uniref:Uncharacterized protein n=1 Tax=Dactylosporangium sucinum TaxID=1424081 RepID=A0A917TX95_9ACTN|nr:DUF6153 family protein [Dactylosporangium sucinum]GGM42586.1 hypothetical protein GCM10007977_050150 [Dactylosporangium sucinum]
MERALPVRTLAAVLLAVAVAWMHTVAVAGIPAPGGHHAAGVVAMTPPAEGTTSTPHVPSGDDGAGGHGRGHAGSMCQAPGLGGAGWSPALLALPFHVAPTGPLPSLPTTVAVDAARGTGCGPPSLAMLSILRT